MSHMVQFHRNSNWILNKLSSIVYIYKIMHADGVESPIPSSASSREVSVHFLITGRVQSLFPYFGFW
jgi:hypothetical protein